ncbi:MAG: SDR family NAD(P)-dependent oxidoreductase, partial [Candidatus Acidiferrales bacterium]
MTLKDRVAVVTGASQGIGRATALMLAGYGAKVALAARNAEKLSTLEAEIKQQNGEALAVPMDVAREEQIKTGFAKVLERFGRIDILVNNAALTRDQLALRMKRADWDAVIETNLTGAHLCIQQVMPGMLRQRSGRIINITSVVAQTGNAGQANYVAAKAGLIGLTKATARELASRNITCNAVAPGFVLTELTQDLPENLQAQINERTPLGRFGTVEE